MSPERFLDEIVARLDATSGPDSELAAEIGCGDLENLIREDGEVLWPRIEALARTNIRFRHALSSVWAYESPEFERRQALLRELGEAWDVTVTFVVEPQDFASPPTLSWRACEVQGAVPGAQLPRLLREIADSVEEDLSRTEQRP